MEFWIPFGLIALVIGAVFVPKIWATWKAIKSENPNGIPLGMEEIDIDGFEDAVKFNEAKANLTASNRKDYSNMSAQRGPLRMGKTGDEYSKNYHKLFGRKSK